MTQPVVDVGTLPGDDVYPDLVDSNAAGLRGAGQSVASRGVRVNAHWKKLGAHYGAPETESLVGKLAPAETAAATFGSRMGSAASALEAFAEEARGIKKRAEAIRARAKTFLDGVVAHGVTKQTYIPSSTGGGYTKVDHERWDQNSAAVAENDAIIGEIEQLANDLEAAEARCADAITAAVGAKRVTGPGTSVDWTSVPAGTATPWGMEMGRRNETNDEAIGRGMLTGLIGLETSLMSLGGWRNKTMTYEKITGGGFDPFAIEHSWSLEGQSLLGIGKFVAGIGNLVSPVYAPLTLLGLRSKGPLGAYSRATTGTVIDGGKSFLVWDKWKNDPYAAGGELGVNLLSLAIPGGGEAAAPVEIAARVGVRTAEESAEVAGRAGLDAAAESTARAGSGAADAARGGLSHVPEVGLDARTALGHAGERPTGTPGGERAAGMGDAPGDFSLENGPEVGQAPPARAPSHGAEPVHLPEPVRATEAERAAPRVHDHVGEGGAPGRERVPADVGATAEHRTSAPETSGTRNVPERELVHAGAPGRPLSSERSTAGHGGSSGGGDLPPGSRPEPGTPAGRSGGESHPRSDEPGGGPPGIGDDPKGRDGSGDPTPGHLGPDAPAGSAEPGSSVHDPAADHGHGASHDPGDGSAASHDPRADHGDGGTSGPDGHDGPRDWGDIPPENQERILRYERIYDHVPDWLKPLWRGRIFNVEQWHRFPANEVYLDKADGSRVIVDALDPADGRIVSRKDTILGEVQPRTAKEEIRELYSKYRNDGTLTIADVPTARANPALRGLIGKPLRGDLVLEVPISNRGVAIPQQVLDYASDLDVQIIDVNGHPYN